MKQVLSSWQLLYYVFGVFHKPLLKMAIYTKRKIVTLLLIGLEQFCSGLCYSIQGPFYPAEAQKRGATPTQYGFVFGIFQLVVFVFSPVCGRYLGILGAKFINCLGVFIMSYTNVLFGFLGLIQDCQMFVTMSFVVRIVEAIGTSSCAISAFSIIAHEFPDNVASAFSLVKSLCGIGLILGPIIGGVLYEVGGFLLPFVVAGGLMASAFIIVCIFLPSQTSVTNESEALGKALKLLKEPSIIINGLVVFASSYGVGFLQAVLEPHVQTLNLTSIQIGTVFMVYGGAFAFASPFWGRLCDRTLTPYAVSVIGIVIIILSSFFLGPAPFLPMHLSLYSISISLVVYSFGLGATIVSSFSGLQKNAVTLGLPDEISTYALASGLWNSLFSLGLFIGPSVAGILYEIIGFPWASQTISFFNVILLLCLCVSYYYQKKCNTIIGKSEVPPVASD